MLDNEDAVMTNKEKHELTEHNKNADIIFTPNKVHLDKLAHQLTPEIKKYFANEQIQREFAEWVQTRNSSP